MGIGHIKFAFAAMVCAYALAYLASPESWHFIDSVDLVIHEAGHTLAFFAGEFVRVLAGSVFQVAVPLAFSGYFIRKGDAYSAGLTLVWAGLSTVNVSVYAGDAALMELPLLGGEGVIHDWNYLLGRAGMLDDAALVAAVLKAAGAAAAIWGSIAMLARSSRSASIR